MKYHYTKPTEYSSMYGQLYECNHPAYNHCTLYLIGDKGLAVIQQRYDKKSKCTWWSEIDRCLTDALYLHSKFKSVFDKYASNDGAGSRNVYSGFRSDIFEKKVKEVRDDDKSRRASWIKLEKSEVGKIGPFEDLCSDAPAQYANSDETPRKGWTKVKTKLKDLNVSKLHYVKVPEWLIVIDFDLKDEDGNKSLEKNLEAASKWPATYAEVSKGGAGLHLHYIYKGDVSKVKMTYYVLYMTENGIGNRVVQVDGGIQAAGQLQAICNQIMNQDKVRVLQQTRWL